MGLLRVNHLVFLAVLAFVLAATLVATPGASEFVSIWCFFCGERGLADALLNVVLFVPIGIALESCGFSWALAMGMALSVPASIEYVQFIVPGRYPSIPDVVANGVGTALGFAIWRLRHRWLSSTARSNWWRWLVATAAVTSLFLAEGYLATPSVPATLYYGQWTPNLGHLEWYRGRVLSATLGPLAIPEGRFADTDSARKLLSSGAPLEAVAIAGPSVPGLASLVSIYDEWEREIVLVGPDRDDLVYRYRTRASDYRLDDPAVRFYGALRPVQPGDTLWVSVNRTKSGLCLSVDERTRCGMGPALASGWGFLLYPRSIPNDARLLLNLAWIALLVLPVGYWSSKRLQAIAGGLVVLTGLAVVPVLWSLPRTRPVEYGAALAGLLVGHLVGEHFRHKSVSSPVIRSLQAG